MDSKKQIAFAIADTFLAHEASVIGLMKSATWVLGKKWPWIPALCRKIHTRTGAYFYYYSRRELAEFILADHGFCMAWSGDAAAPTIKHYCLDPPLAVEKPEWLSALSLPELRTSTDLATWLGLRPGELDWFADKWRVDSRGPVALQHYRYRWLVKPSGGVRLLEMPKLRLRLIQGQILRRILNAVPAHPAAHGFCKTRSCVTHAVLHVGKRVVMRMDLKDFFTSIPAARVHALFSKLGYPDAVAGCLSRLCTHRTPGNILVQQTRKDHSSGPRRSMSHSAHLPQGAPSSPALANLCAYRLDVRLDSLAKAINASYSRYADDLTFSGDNLREKSLDRLTLQVGAIALEEGFAINFKKNRIMRAATRQLVTGIVVNAHPNIKRVDFDNLKATLTNCIRHGHASQNHTKHDNFRAHLLGKIAHVQMVNAARGARLRALFDQIVWLDDTLALH